LVNILLSSICFIIFSALIKTKEKPEGEQVSRKYTPISWFLEQGKIELLIKVYYKDVNPNWPEGGKMSQYLASLDLESFINIRGPFGRFSYFGDGSVKIGY
jgi:hypothetical protein